MSQEVIKVRHADLSEWQKVPGGWNHKLIGKGAKFLTEIGYSEPGEGETWHKHGPEFEETYYVLKGTGKMSWKSDGKEFTVEFSEGDCLYLPFGLENMFVNTGKEKLWMLFTISNVAKMRE